MNSYIVTYKILYKPKDKYSDYTYETKKALVVEDNQIDATVKFNEEIFLIEKDYDSIEFISIKKSDIDMIIITKEN